MFPSAPKPHLLLISLVLCLIVIGLAEAKQPEQLARVAVDLYVISGCPYCKEAEAVMRQLSLELGDKLDFGLYFIPPATGDELDEEGQIQLLIKQHFPDKFWAYVDCRNQDIAGMPWQACAAKTGIDLQPIVAGLTSGQGEKLLRQNQAQAQRLQISSAPTLFINHKPYSGQIEGLALISHICQRFPSLKAASACQELPECLNDEDCYKVGMVGSCERAGTRQARCSYQPAEVVALTIVGDEQALKPQDEPLNWLGHLFPGLKSAYITADSPEGKQLIAEYELERLPAYLFTPAVLNTNNIDQLKSQLRFVKGRLLLTPSATQARIYIKRSLNLGRIEFLFSPLSPLSNKVLLDIYRILEQEQSPPDFGLRYVVRRELNGSFSAPYGQTELEEISRQLVIKRDHPDKFRAYIELRSQGLASSYWEEALLALGLDAHQIKQKAKSKTIKEQLTGEAIHLEGLEVSSSPVFLVNNRELIELRNRQQFRELLNQLANQSPNQGQ